MMKKYSVLGSVLISLFVLAIVSQVAMSAEKIDGWASMRNDTQMMQGALSNTVTFEALRTYIPNVGVVFVMNAKGGISLEQVRAEFEKALKFIVPTISNLPEDELVVLAISPSTVMMKDWELIYVTTKKEAANPDAWKIYYNERPAM